MKFIFYTTILLLFFVPSAMAEAIPTGKEVKSVAIKFYHRELKKNVEFKATAEDWEAIRSHLVPAKYDAKPSKWIFTGSVKIVKKDGQPFHIELYNPRGGLGAFAAGKTYKQRKYYRGGRTAELIKALRAAFEKSRITSKKKG